MFSVSLPNVLFPVENFVFMEAIVLLETKLVLKFLFKSEKVCLYELALDLRSKTSQPTNLVKKKKKTLAPDFAEAKPKNNFPSKRISTDFD